MLNKIWNFAGTVLIGYGLIVTLFGLSQALADLFHYFRKHPAKQSN